VPLSRIAHTEGTPDQIAEGFDYYNSLRSSGADNSSVASTSALAKMTRKPDEWASGRCQVKQPKREIELGPTFGCLENPCLGCNPSWYAKHKLDRAGERPRQAVR
jgi:hypothetical protein